MARRVKVPAGGPREQAILRALRMGCTRRAAMAIGDITPPTFYRMLEDVTFRDAVEKAEGEAEATYSAIVADAAPKSWQAAAWWLERRRSEHFGRHDRVEMTVDVRKEAERVAAEFGLDPDAVMAEAEAVLRGA